MHSDLRCRLGRPVGDSRSYGRRLRDPRLLIARHRANRYSGRTEGGLSATLTDTDGAVATADTLDDFLNGPRSVTDPPETIRHRLTRAGGTHRGPSDRFATKPKYALFPDNTYPPEVFGPVSPRDLLRIGDVVVSAPATRRCRRPPTSPRKRLASSVFTVRPLPPEMAIPLIVVTSSSVAD